MDGKTHKHTCLTWALNLVMETKLPLSTPSSVEEQTNLRQELDNALQRSLHQQAQKNCNGLTKRDTN